jgi:mono/diheme cytochrome c family protein
MEVLAFLAPFVLLGVGIIFVAFSGGPGRAREAYLTKGGRLFRFSMALLYALLGLAVPALIIADSGQSQGGTPPLQHEKASSELEEGKELFRQTCTACHTLAAANARGVTGPDLDGIGEMTEERVLQAIKVGGTGQKRMPAALLEGEDAEAVAQYVSAVAGKK